MYDYYIVMKSMFLVVKLYSHSSIVYVNITILLLSTIHNQHQNYSKPKASKKILNFHSHKFSTHIITLYTKMKGPFKVTNTSLNTNQKGNYSRNFLKGNYSRDFQRETTQKTSKRKLLKKLPKGKLLKRLPKGKLLKRVPKKKLLKRVPKTYPSHGSSCDSIINDKKTTSHGFPCDSTINYKKSSHGPLCDSIIIKRKRNHMAYMTSTLICESQDSKTKSNP